MESKMNYPPNNLRPIQINFELYVDSDDAEFKLELVQLMISNIGELKEISQRAWDNHDLNVFNSCTHKTKSTVILLDDPEFNGIIEDVRRQLTVEQSSRHPEVMVTFHELCNSIITSLEHEAALLKPQ